MTRGMPRTTIGFVGLMLLCAALVGSQVDLQYRSRGDRHEGVPPKPISGYDIELISALVDYREGEPVNIPQNAFISLDKLDTFPLAGIDLDESASGLKLRLYGEADNVRSTSDDLKLVDHRLTQYHRLQHNALWAFLCAVAVWAFLTTVGAYEPYKKFKISQFILIFAALVLKCNTRLGIYQGLIWILCLTTFLIPLHAQADNPTESNVAELFGAVVRIEVDGYGTTKNGSGFVFRLEPAAAYIVTSAHVVAGNQVRVFFYPDLYRAFPSEILARDTDEDPSGIAVLKVQGDIPKGVGTLLVDSSSPVAAGEELLLIGFPSTSQIPRLIKGIMSAQIGKQIVFDRRSDEGFSGGPLLRDGLVIGVATAADRNFTYAIPAMILEMTLVGWQIELNSFGSSKSDPVRKPLSEVTLDSRIPASCRSNNLICTSNLSFIDGITKSLVLSEEAKLIDEAVREGMQVAADTDPRIIINAGNYAVPNTGKSINQLIDIFFNPNLTNDEKYTRAVSKLLDPHGVDTLITGMVVDTGAAIQIRPMGIVKLDATIKTKDLHYANRDELFINLNGTLALSPIAYQEIQKAVQEIFPPPPSNLLFTSNISFMDGVVKATVSPQEAVLIDRAVRDGMAAAAGSDPTIIVNAPKCDIPKTAASVNQMIDIYFDPNLTSDQKYDKMISDLMDPYDVDVLISGIVVDTGGLIQVRPMGVSKPDATIKTKDLRYTNRDEFFIEANDTLVLSDKAYREIRKAVKEILE